MRPKNWLFKGLMSLAIMMSSIGLKTSWRCKKSQNCLTRTFDLTAASILHSSGHSTISRIRIVAPSSMLLKTYYKEVAIQGSMLQLLPEWLAPQMAKTIYL